MKEVIAIQALLKEEEIIRHIWLDAVKELNADCAIGNGSRPHMTIASFKLDDKEINEITDSFSQFDNTLPSIKFDVQIRGKETDKGIFYTYVPKTVDEQLIKLHDDLYNGVDKGYERFRKIDEPGSFRPHISLFTIDNNSVGQAGDIFEKLEKINSVTIKGFVLVRFTYPVSHLKEIKTTTLL